MRARLKVVQAAAIKASQHALCPDAVRVALLELCALLVELVDEIEKLKGGRNA